MKADLHCHTTISDGSLGISDVIRQADRNDVRCLAITDHDSLASLSRSAVLGKRYNVNVIPAVEFSAFDSERKKKVHILCYMPASPTVSRVCACVPPPAEWSLESVWRSRCSTNTR